MLFTTFTFTCFFLIVLFLWWTVIPKKDTYRKVFLIIVSFIFYSWADPRWALNLFIICLFTYLMVKFIAKSDKYKKILGVFTTITLIAQLVFWKYIPWAALSWNEYVGINYKEWIVTPPEWAFPVGLSFFTFHALSLVIPTWLENRKPLNLLSTFAHISFFPSLLAGPVLRRDDIEYRWNNNWNWKDVEWSQAIGRIMIGMTFKWVFASQAATYADPIFQGMSSNTYEIWIGIHAYAFQIFFDFAGYSHIAIGIALLLGWKIPENFKFPYLSTSIQVFWRNWHRSLSFFFRDNFYIHLLGGNRKGKNHALVNGFFTMVVSGLWHGANLTFIVWGAWHGLLLVIQGIFKRYVKLTLPALLTWFITFELVVWGWVWFRAENFDIAISTFKSAWSLNNFNESHFDIATDQIIWLLVMFFIILIEKHILYFMEKITFKIEQGSFVRWLSTPVSTLVLVIWTWLIMYFGPVGVPAFIYNGF